MRVVQDTGGAPLSTPPDAAEEPLRAKRVGSLAVVAVLVYVLDLVGKTLVVRFLEDREPVSLAGDLLRLRVIRNSGAAFSIGTGMTIIFTVIAAGVVIAILRTARRLRSFPWAIVLGLLLGGAIGNLTDRIFRAPAPFQGHVVDWIEVFPATHFPVFNIADSAIVCGGALAVLLAWRGFQIDGTRTGDEPDEPDGARQDLPDRHDQRHLNDQNDQDAGRQAARHDDKEDERHG
ncbi:signal peptidase II [Sphaerisporangium corydalis]|uniref:Lipoprotein signal peptidase n=1 Tax=Sphaerisporangium corydalis TaxID=1441875 RepID=A0ABV9EN56_9ACTN|nr:signal peptidase II [Sphaerisporangium corydalis]